MEPRIINSESKILVGLFQNMSLVRNSTAELWMTFMQRRGELVNRVSTDLYSLQVYPANYFSSFDPNANFVKWAAAEVAEGAAIPNGMSSMQLPGGTYAVFDHKGANDPSGAFRYIYTQWLPDSGFQLDDRPHFERLGPRYKNNDPESEEEIWIPVR